MVAPSNNRHIFFPVYCFQLLIVAFFQTNMLYLYVPPFSIAFHSTLYLVVKEEIKEHELRMIDCALCVIPLWQPMVS